MGLGVKKVLAVSEVRQEFDKLQRYLSFFDLTFEHAANFNSQQSLVSITMFLQTAKHLAFPCPFNVSNWVLFQFI